VTTVVTGASGFLGGAVVRELMAQDREVRAVDLHRGPTLDGLDVEFVHGDVLDRPSLDIVFEDAGAVYHLAGLISITGDPDGRVHRVNVDGVRNVAEAALGAGVQRLIHCSSVHAYDLEAPADLLSETSPRATAPGLPAYDRSKAGGEAALREVADRGLDSVVINPTGIIGPYDFGPSRMGRVFQALFRKRLPALIEGGFDWVDSRDVASAMVTAESRGRTGENYLLPGHHLSIPDLAGVAEEVSSVPKPRWTVPMWLARVWSPLGDVFGRRSESPLWYTSESLHALEHTPAVSSKKALEELGHSPRPVNETVGDIYRWFKDNGDLD
jgi:dihydroflavonol-4-reductase